METVQTDVPQRLAPLAKCAHAMCTCTVAQDEQYCSDYCASAANAGKEAADGECSCGHPECAMTTSSGREES
jgi:hypothetical protein